MTGNDVSRDTPQVFKIWVDKETGFVISTLYGFLNDDDADAYLKMLDRLTSDARARFGHVRLLVDRTAAAVQSANVVYKLRDAIRISLRLPADRVAIVGKAGLGEMQTRRAVNGTAVKLFTSAPEATRWLSA